MAATKGDMSTRELVADIIDLLVGHMRIRISKLAPILENLVQGSGAPDQGYRL